MIIYDNNQFFHFEQYRDYNYINVSGNARKLSNIDNPFTLKDIIVMNDDYSIRLYTPKLYVRYKGDDFYEFEYSKYYILYSEDKSNHHFRMHKIKMLSLFKNLPNKT